VIRNRSIAALATTLLLLALATVVRADSPPPVLRSALTGGGGTLAASGYTLTGAIGQPLAGPVATQGQYALTSGLFGGSVGASSHVYVSMVRR
jgi:hypothetical protein